MIVCTVKARRADILYEVSDTANFEENWETHIRCTFVKKNSDLCAISQLLHRKEESVRPDFTSCMGLRRGRAGPWRAASREEPVPPLPSPLPGHRPGHVQGDGGRRPGPGSASGRASSCLSLGPLGHVRSILLVTGSLGAFEMLFLKILKFLIFTCQFLINVSAFEDDFFF